MTSLPSGRRHLLQTVTLTGERCTLIVDRPEDGRAAPVWLSFHGVQELTVVMSRPQADDLSRALGEAAA